MSCDRLGCCIEHVQYIVKTNKQNKKAGDGLTKHLTYVRLGWEREWVSVETSTTLTSYPLTLTAGHQEHWVRESIAEDRACLAPEGRIHQGNRGEEQQTAERDPAREDSHLQGSAALREEDGWGQQEADPDELWAGQVAGECSEIPGLAWRGEEEAEGTEGKV